MVTADSSFLVSCYVRDTNTVEALAFLEELSEEIFVTGLTLLEVANAMRARVFSGKMSEKEADMALTGFDADVASGSLKLAVVPRSVWSQARTLALAHTATLGVCSLDILHIAIALELGAGSFLTFDRNQARLAQVVGIDLPIRIA